MFLVGQRQQLFPYSFSARELKITYGTHLIGVKGIFNVTVTYRRMPAVVIVEVTQYIPNR